jgi:choline-sulfatase
MMGAHGLIGKEVMYEESVRVPLTISVPFNSVKPGRVATPVSTVDIVPTLLELMGSNVLETLQGQSLIPAIHGEGLERSCVLIEWNRADDDEASDKSCNGRTLVTANGWKLVLYAGDECMLFDRNNDPFEMNNLYHRPESATIVKRLRGYLKTWQKRTDDRLEF